MMNKSMLKGLPQLQMRVDMMYPRWHYVKAHQLSYKESLAIINDPLELIHSNVFGHLKKPLVGVLWYMATFINDYSRHVRVYFMKETSETLAFKEFKETVAAKIGKKIKCLQTYNGGEYISQEFTKYL
ncbi:hypothetical protein CRG98_043508 [Punica granatum]|uniref:Integrase catalytic domain-containing protein n=1 Tax=Punica granatum TaxID=22663 RepID=A0A2I0HWL4_PUNGR|nr:hypothetical protein CRG98_043508 [Punica granatum]